MYVRILIMPINLATQFILIPSNFLYKKENFLFINICTRDICVTATQQTKDTKKYKFSTIF